VDDLVGGKSRPILIGQGLQRDPELAALVGQGVGIQIHAGDEKDLTTLRHFTV
jgi:hypothetical protein